MTLLAVAALVLAPSTTAPGVVYVKPLVITNTRILIHDRRTTARGGVQRYPRGAIVRYVVRNRGTRPFTLNVLGSSTGVLAPGRTRSILVGWNRRGRFTFRALPRGPAFRVVVY